MHPAPGFGDGSGCASLYKCRGIDYRSMAQNLQGRANIQAGKYIFLCILVSVLGKRLHITSLSWGRPCCSQRSLVPLLASCAELLMMCEVGLVQSCRHRFDCFKRLCFPGYLFTLLTIFPRAGFYSCSAVRAALMQPCLCAEQTLEAGFSALRR